MLETTIENRKIKPWFEKVGCKCIKLLPTWVGIPDRLVIGPGKLIFFMETKRNKKEPEKIQHYVHKQLREYGFNVYVCKNLEQAQSAFTKETGIEVKGRRNSDIHFEILSRNLS